MEHLLSAAVLSGVGASIVAIVATIAIERCGGALGGVLATLPTTIVPASIAWGSRLSNDALALTTAAVPVGMLIDAGVLLTWRYLPSALPRGWSSLRKLALVTAASIAVWLVLALCWSAVEIPASAAVGVAISATLLLLLLGGAASAKLPPAAEKPSTHAAPLVLAARGVGAGLAIFGAVLLSAVHPTAGGLFATFPAIFTTVQVSLWISHGEALPLSATGPMVLGSTAVATYALLFLPLLASGPNVFAAAAAAWVLSVSLVSVPVARFLQWRQAAAGVSSVRALEEAGQDTESASAREEAGGA